MSNDSVKISLTSSTPFTKYKFPSDKSVFALKIYSNDNRDDEFDIYTCDIDKWIPLVTNSEIKFDPEYLDYQLKFYQAKRLKEKDDFDNRVKLAYEENIKFNEMSKNNQLPPPPKPSIDEAFDYLNDLENSFEEFKRMKDHSQEVLKLKETLQIENEL